MNAVASANRETGPAVQHHNENGGGAFLLVCEHASNLVPPGIDLGVEDSVLSSHAAWDPGALPVARYLADLLDSPLVAGGWSRLVYDLNRPPSSPDAMRSTSEVYAIPGNARLNEEARNQRVNSIYHPFREAVSSGVARLEAERRDTALVTIHTFTPVFHGRPRSVELGILHDEDDRLARALHVEATPACDLNVAMNEPYGMADGVTHTLAEHAVPRGLHNVMIEIRNDLVADASAQRSMASLLARILPPALDAARSSVSQSTIAQAGDSRV